MPDRPESKRNASLLLLVVITLVTLFVWNLPFVGIVLSPLNTFVTTLHEIGHASFCLATGGSVTGMTIVSDGDGHGGLTMCQGGWPLVYTQTGYLGTALFGCLFICLGRKKENAKPLLIGMGVLIAAAALWFMTGTIMHGNASQGGWSMVWALVIAGVLIAAGVKLGPAAGQAVVMFLSVITALNALTDVFYLIVLSVGLYPSRSFSDATNMAALTHIPAAIWSILWGAAAVAMLYYTVRWTYFRKSAS